MRIAQIVTRADDFAGAEVHVRDLATALIERGHNVTVLAGGDGVFARELEKAGIPWERVPHLVKPISPQNDARALRELTAALGRLRPDLVATHTSKAGFLGRFAAAVVRVPAVFTPHGWAITDRISPAQGRIFRWAERAAGLVSSRIINVCEFERQLAVRHRIAPGRKLAVVHNGMADVPEHLQADPGASPPRLIMVARMARQKDHATLLSALAQLKDRAWELDLVGDGPLEAELRQQACQLRLTDRVRFLGFRTDVRPYLAEAQIFVLTTRFEAFPYSTLEAMRAGLPVVASNTGGIPEAVEDGTTGFLPERGDAAGLAECLSKLIDSAELRTAMGAAGRQRFLQRFTFEQMIDATLKVYGEALGKRR